MTTTESITVEVAYATPSAQKIVCLQVVPGCTAAEAVAQSGLLAQFALTEEPLKLGIFGRSVAAEQALRAGDRVEIYRPLLADPKEVRRRRARAGKA